MDNTTVILGIALVGLLALYLLTYPFFRSATKQTIYIPPKTVGRLRSSAKNSRGEVVVKLDYQPGTDLPTRTVVKKGKNDRVFPGFIHREEVVAHTHPRSHSQDPNVRAYEDVLRERPSFSDLVFSKSKEGPELLVTHSGRIIEFDAEEANLGEIRGLEERAQVEAARVIPPTDPHSARRSASLANAIFVRESSRAGVRYREFRGGEVKLRTKVK